MVRGLPLRSLDEFGNPIPTQPAVEIFEEQSGYNPFLFPGF
jgi:hypothetical protein